MISGWARIPQERPLTARIPGGGLVVAGELPLNQADGLAN